MVRPAAEKPPGARDVESLEASRYPGRATRPPADTRERSIDELLQEAADRLFKAKNGFTDTVVYAGPTSSLTELQKQNFAAQIQKHPKFLEISRDIKASGNLKDGLANCSTEADRSKLRHMITFYNLLFVLLSAAMQAQVPEQRLMDLEKVHAWYRQNKPPPEPRQEKFEFILAPGDALPGSAFFKPEADEQTPRPSNVQPQHTGKSSPRTPFARVRAIPSQRDSARFKDLKLKQALLGLDDDSRERPLTPSTTVGGLTARSALSSRAPTAHGSRPSSAFGSRPTSAAARRDTSPPSLHHTVPAPFTPPASSRAFSAAVAASAAAEDRNMSMEQRWLARRHRDISSDILRAENRDMMKSWAQRKSRAELEITRGIEAARYSSTLSRREYHGDHRTDETDNESDPRRLPTPPVFDVSTPVGGASRIQHHDVDDELEAVNELRKMNAHLLHQASEPVIQLPVSQSSKWISLSPYLLKGQKQPFGAEEHDEPILDWQRKHQVPADETTDFEALRLQQLEEAHKVKLALGSMGVPVNSAKIESALVMPRHQVKEHVAYRPLRSVDGQKYNGIGQPQPFIHQAKMENGKVKKRVDGTVEPDYDRAPPLPRLLVNPLFKPEAAAKGKKGRKKKK